MAGKKTTKNDTKKSVEALSHGEATRRNIPTAEFQSVMEKELQSPIRIAYERRNRDLDPQLVWRGKDEQDWSDLVVNAPPLYIQEKVHPKVLIDDLKRQAEKAEAEIEEAEQPDLFADFNGVPSEDAKTEFYQHDQNWSNRMILGDSLQVMASLAEREGLRGKVQCIYFDPPYGIKFNSNFQWSTTSRDVKDGNAAHITREPEQVKAFRDTWSDGIHTYLTYLRDRITVARDLLADTGSIFIQIGDENVHRVRALLDEVFGEENALSEIVVKKKGGQKGEFLDSVNDFILWYGKDRKRSKSKPLYESFQDESEITRDFRLVDLGRGQYSSISQIANKTGKQSFYSVKPLQIEKDFEGAKLFKSENFTGGKPGESQAQLFEFNGRVFDPGLRKGLGWKHSTFSQNNGLSGMQRLAEAGRVYIGRNQIGYVRYFSDFGLQPVSNWWDGFGGASNPIYVVQTNVEVVKRCILLATDPGDLVLDPTCGSGTTAYAAEQWGRRWITIDTSRVSLALTRARIMGAKFPYYLLADSTAGVEKEAQINRTPASVKKTYGDVRRGFVYHRKSYITSTVIANNTEIDVISDKFRPQLEGLRAGLKKQLGTKFEKWEIPRQPGTPWSDKNTKLHATVLAADTDKKQQAALAKLNTALERKYSLEDLPEEPFDLWDDEKAVELHKQWWELRIARQQEIDASVTAKADQEYLYDKPYEDKKKVRVAGPFTVESLSPHRVLGLDENDELIDPMADKGDEYSDVQDFTHIILENLRVAGVQQAHKEDKIRFSSITPWPGHFICAEGRYLEGEEDTGTEKRAGIFIGPEFGTVSRQDLVAAAREAGDADFDVLIACAFSYEGHASDFNKLGRIPVLKARMNADLHMADELKNTDKANLFVIFGEPDIEILPADGDQIQVRINGVDVFHPNTGEVRSDNADGIACWFVDTDYNEESFFVRHAYFLGANDPYKALKNTLKAEINEEAWESLNSDTSRPFEKPSSGRIAVKVINHLGDEVMKVYSV